MTTTAPEVETAALIHKAAWQARVSHTALGKAIGNGQTTMSKKLRGEVPITLREMFVLAGVLDLDPADLVLRACRDSNPKPSDP